MDLFNSGDDKVRRAIPEDVQIIAENMRESDKNEIWASDNITPMQAVTTSFRTAAACWTIVSRDNPVAMFGMCPVTWAGQEAFVWLLATKDFCKISGKFLKRSRAFIKIMLECYPYLHNYVDCRNTQSIKWLEFCGAKFNPPQEFGIEHKMFQYFEFRDNSLPKVVPSLDDVREKIMAIQGAISKIPGAMFGNNEMCPLNHIFADGVYIREIFIPKNFLGVGRIHKHSHGNFLMKGEVTVLTESGGIERIKAPRSMVSLPGTKRVLYTHEDCIWITVHANPKEIRDIEELEKMIVAEDYEELGIFLDNKDKGKKEVNLLDFISSLQKGVEDAELIKD